MFSTNAQDYSKLIEIAFIAGISQCNLKSYINTYDNSFLIPDCLLAFPNHKELINRGILEVN